MGDSFSRRCFQAKLMRWRDRHELAILATIFRLAGGAWVFIELAEEVLFTSGRNGERKGSISLKGTWNRFISVSGIK